MTVLELHTLFQVHYDKVASQSYPELIQEEVDLFLNLAQDIFIERSYPTKIENIYSLIQDANINTSDIYPTTGYTAVQGDLPDDYYYFVESSSYVTLDTESYWRSNKYDNNFILRRLRVNRHNKPIIREPIFTLVGDNAFNVFHDAEITINSINLRYIKKPNTINLSTDVSTNLPLSTHESVVILAVKLAAESIESPRIQSLLTLYGNE